MPNPVLILDPQNELKFKVDFAGMFEPGCTTHLKLTNPSMDSVLFKIKTTAPKKYCVRPNSGLIQPNSRMDIAITPQPVFVDQNEKHKHKFMVQSVIAPEGKTNIDQVWKEISPDQLIDCKLKCVFETPRDTNLNDSGDNAAQNEVNKKRVAVPEEAKPSLKGMTFKTDNTESELRKANLEVILLKEEESKLRRENLQIKEELLRLRQSGEGRAGRGHSYGLEKPASPSVMPWVFAAMAMAALGFILGKFFM